MVFSCTFPWKLCIMLSESGRSLETEKKRGKKVRFDPVKKYKKKQKNCLLIEFNRKVLVVVWLQKAVYTSIDCAGTVG